MTRRLLAVSLLVTTLAAGAAADDDRSIRCGLDGSISWGPTVLWPPDGELEEITFAYDTDDAKRVTLAIAAKAHNETLDEIDDLTGTGITPAPTDQQGGAASAQGDDIEVIGRARAERRGVSWGARVYRFEYAATADRDGDGTDDDGCASDPADDLDDLLVVVPAQCRGACDD